MSRFDLYRSVHKGLRAGLFQTAQLVGRTEFAAPAEAAAAASAVKRLLGFLHEHAEHEDEAILPELARIAPELHADLVSEHARVEGVGAEVSGLADRLAGATEAERVSLGQRLHVRMGRLVAEHLRHMEREEVEANRVLWAHRSDAELGAIEGRIVGAIPAPRMSEWLELMLPAMSASERAELLGGMHRAMPSEAFDELTAAARGALGDRAWRTSLAAAGI